jgi:hypothetical protein
MEVLTAQLKKQAAQIPGDDGPRPGKSPTTLMETFSCW